MYGLGKMSVGRQCTGHRMYSKNQQVDLAGGRLLGP